ncbi:MAG: hypothetical protein IPJ36_19420 [Simplicispira sp.]|nr:hypothetical protein [Simplicispira sp.]
MRWVAQPKAPSLQEEDDDTLDLRDLWRMVVKHKGLLVSVALVGLLAAVLLSFIKTPLYLATTTVQVDKRAARVVKFAQEADANQDVDERTALGTQLELLKSRVLAERVIDELQLDRQGLLMPTAAAAEGEAPALADGEADAPEATRLGRPWRATCWNASKTATARFARRRRTAPSV